LTNLEKRTLKTSFQIIGMKDERLTYQEARIDAMQREIEKLNIEILNLEYKLKQAENAINEYNYSR
jgi:predicted RNase H-like nuclease (RuvC/YqgF family)